MTDAVDDATVDDLRRVLGAIDAEAPPAVELAERLADATAVDVADAQATVYDAIDAGVLVEEGEGFGGVRLAEEYREPEPRVADYCSLTLETREREATDETPLDQYRHKGYVQGDSREETALDAAVALTASSWGPPHDTEVCNETDPWGEESYRCACAAVEDAIAEALLAADETTETPDSGDIDTREPPKSDDDPRGETGETAEDDLGKYRRVYLRAAEAADREPWEYVEEAYVRAALEEVGFAHLLDEGHLFKTRWRVVDVSDEEEEPRRRWYFPSDDEPRPGEFRRFHELLIDEAPDDYTPHYFKVERAGKAPATQFGSWKTDEAGLTVEEAVAWLREGGNVGIAGRPDDPLINVDIDDDEATTPDDVPTSLRARSRSRTGWHTWYFDTEGEVPNIPTDAYGEIRTDWQYVVAPGSFVASTAEEIPDDADHPGYYTVADEAPVAEVGYEDLPEVFKEAAEAAEENDETAAHGEPREAATPDVVETSDADSAVYDLEAEDLTRSRDPDARFTSLFHDSSTGSNMSVSRGKLHCWRHNVAHGGLQAYATLADVRHVRSYGCRDLGAAHKNGGSGSNALRGDWRLVWGAWYEAKRRGALREDDPVPYRVLRELAVADDLVDRDALVARSSETGAVVEDAEDTDTYRALPSGTYNDALEHVRDEYGVEPGRDPVEGTADREEAEEYDDDPREVSATVDAHRAWDAAGRVTPADVDDDRLDAAGEGAFACPTCGSEVDVVRAVAVLEGLAECCDGALDADTYPEAYARARTEYGAPLPEYYTTADAIAEFDAVLDVIGEVGFDHLDADAIASDITATGDEVGGDAVAAMNPAWRLSESGESVLVFDSGVVWDADTERVLDALRFVALDSGLLTDATEPLEGEAFTEAYRRARTEYGAPLPRWEPALDGARDLTPQLPPAEDLLDAREVDGVGVDELEAAREDVEALIREAARDADTPTVVTALPALGKTTGTIKTARDRPLSYLAPRKELQEQALDKADEWGVDAFVLPVFAGERVRDEVLDAATAYVREHDKTPLRERWSLLEAAVDGADEDVDPADIFDTDEEEDREEVSLDRATCPTADGDHGVAWALAVHVARRLGYTPRQIHAQARGLFGAALPCEHDHGDGEDADSGACAYSEAWEEARSPEDPYDLLVGSYTHAHVDSVRTAYDTGPDGETERNARTVVLDEFVGEAYAHGFDDHADDHARWLASALRADVDDRRDMYEADLFGDEWVRAWLDGEGETVDSVDDALATLGRLGDLFDAREGAATVRDEVDADLLDTFDLEAPLAQLAGGDDAADVCRDLTRALGSVDRHHPAAGVAEWVADAVAEPLERATADAEGVPDVETVDLEALPVAGDLADLVAGAVEAVADGSDDAEGRLRAAVKALRGGREGCEVLAAWADDGYAHPDAHHLLEAIATPTGADAPENATRVETSAWAFDDSATDGTTVDVVETGARATVVLDRNGHGARLHNPPARTHAGGEETPLVGLDATGRAELWRVALGEPVETADIHDTPAERAAFLEDALDLRVLRASDRPRYYSGDPGTKDTDGDAGLLQRVAEEYAGIDAPRRRGDDPVPVGRPAAITSKGVREVLENDSRLDDVVSAWEHFGNLAGANDLGDHRLGAVLGCQHYGDDAIERFAALDGEAVDVSRGGARGAELSYDSDLGDAYLQHMTEDQVMQAILRFARGDSGATVVARTGALREDLPVVGEAQVVETWSDTATAIARRYRRLGDRFTVADVADAVDVSRRQVRRVLADLAEAGYIQRVSAGDGVATVYAPGDQPGAAEVDLPDRETAVDATAGHTASKEYYTWNVRVAGGETAPETGSPEPSTRPVGAPPAPEAVEGSGPRG